MSNVLKQCLIIDPDKRIKIDELVKVVEEKLKEY